MTLAHSTAVLNKSASKADVTRQGQPEVNRGRRVRAAGVERGV